MIETRLRPSRRALLAGVALGLLASAVPALAAKKKKAAERRAEPAAAGRTLPIPRLVDLEDGATFELVAEPATHAFVEGKPVDVVGYGGTYMGPVLRLRRGTEPTVRLVNRLDRPTNLHWHGLLVPGRFDGGTQPGIAPGATWEARLTVDQPAATLWYHAHVHGRTAQDVHDGLAGMMIVEDDTSARSRLPATWGVDDLPLILQDRDLDASGRPIYVKTAAIVEHGFHGRQMVVNGVVDPIAKVPQRLVRLRLLNASGSRNFRLFFEDQRPFRQIATDAGFLDAPVELTLLVLAPGERAEILIDFTEGAVPLMTGPDEHEHRTGAQIALLPDVIDRPVRLVAFEATPGKEENTTLPDRLADLPPLPRSTGDIKRRRFELRMQADPASVAMAMVAGHDHAAMSHGSMSHGAIGGDGMAAGDGTPTARLTINGKSFEMGRIDEKVTLGATEIWEIVCPDMAHPFHLHGAHFRVLSEDGEAPKLWNRGWKDTILVDNSAELLVTFTRTAGIDAPFVYHCHVLEHEDGGMMGTFTVA